MLKGDLCVKEVLMIVFMIVIGAVIGGMTNFLAIKMLFRPHQPIYFMKKRMPFTPGLIPKRRGEIAEQLGRLVVKHLLTAEGFKRKLQDATFIQQLIVWAQEKARKFLQSEATIENIMKEKFHVHEARNWLEWKTEEILGEKLDRLVHQYASRTISDVLPKEVTKKLEGSIPNIASYIIDKLRVYVESEEGKEKLGDLIDQFLKNKGTLGNMVSMFLGNARLVDKVQPEIIKFLNNEQASMLIEELLINEWEKLKSRKCEILLPYIDKEKVIEQLKDYIIQEVPAYDWLNAPLSSWTHRYEDGIINKVIPKLGHLAMDVLAEQSEELLVKLHLEELVREQVEGFSLAQLEEMVLSISRRELKMITYLGALLGGLIGFVQGIIVIFV